MHRTTDLLLSLFVELTDAPVTDSLAYDARGVLAALCTRLEDHVIVSTTDGSTFEPVLN